MSETKQEKQKRQKKKNTDQTSYCIDYYIPACRSGRNPYGQTETGYGKTAEKR